MVSRDRSGKTRRRVGEQGRRPPRRGRVFSRKLYRRFFATLFKSDARFSRFDAPIGKVDFNWHELRQKAEIGSGWRCRANLL